MKYILWIIAGSLVLATAHADDLSCTSYGKMKAFMKCGEALIQADIPLDEMKSLARTYPESKIIYGYLDNNETKDIAVQFTEEIDNERIDNVAIYKGKPDGSFELVAKSRRIESGKTEIQIKNHSLFITAFNNSLTASDSETYQFKYKSGDLILVGAELMVAHLDEGNKYRTSVNYLTGEIVKITSENGKNSEIRSKLGNKEKGLQFTKAIRFEDFVR